MIKIMHRLINMTGRYKTRIRCSYITSLIKGIFMRMPMVLCFFTISFFMQGKMDKKICLYMLIGVVASVIIEAIFEHITNVLESAAGYMVFADMRNRLGNHLRKLPMGYFTEGNIGKISSVLSTDMVFIEENCMAVLAETVTFMISQGIMVIMMFFLNWKIGILTLIITGVFILVGNLMMKNTLEHSEKKQEYSEHLTDAVLDFTEGIGIIKSYNLLGDKSKSLTENFKKTCDESIAFEIDYSPWARAMYLTYGIGTTATLGLGYYLYNLGELRADYFVGLIIFLFDLFVSIKAYYGQIARLTVTSACLDRIEAVFAEKELEDTGKEVLELSRDGSGKSESNRNSAATKNIKENNPEIEYKNVTFGYTDKDVLKNVSFSIRQREMTALVGPSGGGKSTIANLLARFWDVKDGSIKVRGKDIRDISLGSLMDSISMVFQRVYLFQDTVANNISIGRPDATREEVIEAAKKARCYDFIMQLPEGFDTVIGEGGASLSGGEKQRISIARCILKDSPIVILDEATASVDADNERAIQEAISELCKNKTLLVIAHRLKTIKDADQILLISDGEIKERGTHDELMSIGGQYSHMVELTA
ncbi:ABC transporter ATP-binding protein [Eubacterium ruminantium]|uniref:ABC transporter ATP-binding protein n=1 Tax=Eubacterium ruminantium TaxID=42322 RepID=UPI0015682514|nr:ABC transporter ATP-binding protein [Eubacterium ruminantium]